MEAKDTELSMAALTARIAERKGGVRLTGLRGASKAAVAAQLLRARPNVPVLWICASSRRADAALEDLRTVLGLGKAPGLNEEAGQENLLAFPRYDTPPFDRFSPQSFIVAQRMAVLYRWLELAGNSDAATRPIVFCPCTALLPPVPSRDEIRARTLHLEVGQTFDREALLVRLARGGYTRMPLVAEPGEFSARGDIVDLFPPQRALPVRIELFGDEIESIREFDPSSQRSREKQSYVVAPPPRELQPGRELIIERQSEIRARAQAQGVSETETSALIDALLRGHLPPGAEALAPMLLPKSERALDLLPEDALILIDEPSEVGVRLETYLDEAHANFRASQEAGRLACEVEELFLAPNQLLEGLDQRRAIALELLDVLDPDSQTPRIHLRSRDHSALRHELQRTRAKEFPLAPLLTTLETYREQGWKVTLAVPTRSSAERLHDLLEEYGLHLSLASKPRPIQQWSAPGVVEIREARLSQGFDLPSLSLAIITEEEIFGARERRRSRGRMREGEVISGLANLSKGNPVVHSIHGIGVYQGLVTLEIGRATADFLQLEYAGGDRFFLPVDLLNRIQRYVGADGSTPRIDKLGGSTWEKAKRSVKRSVRKMAEELLALHAARELAPGTAYSGRDRHLEEFEATFAFEETPDQLAAIEDVLEDLQQPKPMDRLVCGDVGYGKTEVAIRAAVRVVMDGAQVAVLVPTTVLAQQHEETFRKRLESLPISIEHLSRFSNTKQARDTLEGLASGRIDIVIGTHRLLQKNVQWQNLGLLIIDEEQRFGVTHKERLKQHRKTVDVLTLTATPIPRTLQQAFTGIRDLSIINTPPADRLAIRTQVCKPSPSLMREAILREVQRGGQVFFIHNRVLTIQTFAEELRALVPEVRILVAHGQMRERELEEHMYSFLHGEADVLLATTIVENGLDLPRANTILINRADHLGLAQLYQLRGRVGRSTHRAYAYLFIPGEEALTADALKRMEAIQDLSEAGSGFRLATMDLEIRGAGNLLGAEQSGKLAAVGFETYMEMLEETIEAMQGQTREAAVDPEIRLPVSARLDESFVPDVNQRLVLYKRLASAPSDSEIERIRDEILDCYGPLPEEAANLLDVIRIKLRARKLGIAAVSVERKRIVLRAAPTSNIDPQRLLNLMSQARSGLRIAPDQKVSVPVPPGGGRGLLDGVLQWMEVLGYTP